MKLLQRFPFMAFVLVLLSIVALCVAQQSVGLLLVAGVLAAVSWYFTEGPRGRSLPSWVAKLLMLTAAMFLALDLLQPRPDVPSALGQFALWMILIKLYEKRTARDYGQLLALSLLLVLIGCLQSTDFFFGLVLAVYVILGIYVLLLHQMHTAHEEVRTRRAIAVDESDRLPALQPVIGLRLVRDFRFLIFTISVATLLLSGTVFIMFPRGEGQDDRGLSSRFTAQQAGFTTDVNLVDGGRITDSRRAVMSVQLFDAFDQAHQSAEPLHLRGATLDYYEGDGRWRRREAVASRVTHRGADWTRLDGRSGSTEATMTLDVRMLHATEVLFSPLVPTAMQMPDLVPVLFDRKDLTLRLGEDVSPISRYRVRFDPSPTSERLRRLQQIRQPAGRSAALGRLEDAEIRELAERLLGESRLATSVDELETSEQYWQWSREAANVFLRFLHSPEFHYTLDLSDVTFPIREGTMMDPVKYFLLELRRGHCEYFAAAFVALCQNVGIESRLVTGYLAASYDESAQQYTVLERHAHAWAEVRTNPYRWSTFDPTPPSFINNVLRDEAGLADRMRWFYDRMDGLWGRTVVSYDARTQNRMARQWDLGIREWARDMTRRLKLWAEEINRMFYFGPAGYIWMGLIALVLFIGILAISKIIHRLQRLKRAARLDRTTLHESPWLLQRMGFYLDMLELLERANLRKPAATPPLIWATQLRDDRPDVAEHVTALVRDFYEVRYGERQLTDDELRRQREHMRGLERALEKKQ
ncbi:MAG: DUF3488 domain-containing protein [Phycisphaerales bacterium]|nr:MAG: DUF3488 domain-containing protein [Phycisphaerales bacterium]